MDKSLDATGFGTQFHNHTIHGDINNTTIEQARQFNQRLSLKIRSKQVF
jgi:hypothetical protein